MTGVQLTTDGKFTQIYVATTSRILRQGLTRKGQTLPLKTVEDTGCNVGCMTLEKDTGEVIVARDDAIYSYNVDGRGPPKAYESPKSQIAIYEDYIALACPPASVSSSDPDTMRKRFGGGTSDAFFSASTFVLLEPDLRLIGHTETMISPVRFIFEVWKHLFTITQDGKVRVSSKFVGSVC